MAEEWIEGASTAYEAGHKVGEVIENETHIGEKAGDALYEHSDPQSAYEASQHFDDAQQAWSEGRYISAAGNMAETFGSMIKGAVIGNNVEAEAPPPLDLPTTEETSMHSEYSAHEEMP